MIMLKWAEPPEAYSSHLVGLFVYVLFCSVLFSVTTTNQAMKVAMQLQLNILPPLA